MSKKVLAALLAVCMVASLLFVPAAAATFTDVDEDHWASGAIERWAGYGVLNGKDAEAGIFDPSAPMTRAEFAKMLVEMLGLTAKSEATFDDVDPEAWYADVVSIAVKAGIISGRPGNKFDPTAPVTFEEAAVMMCRAFGLAQVTSGAEWAKESIEKLTSLGMIGEGADEHLQVGVDCDRAVVAALADAVVKEYVNEDREEPITGEVNGVVLVVKGAKVEIKDATVSAPIVVESAEVTLTGTKAEDVKVSGKDAAIAADEASTVASVTLAGEAPKADIKGEVASVTIAEETTGAVVDAPKAETVENNSTEEATVNGETVEGKPEEPTDPENPDDSTPGSVSGNDAPEALPRPTTGDPNAACEHVWVVGTAISETQHNRSCSKCGKTEAAAHVYPEVGGQAGTAATAACECGYTTKATAGTVTGGNDATCTHENWTEDTEAAVTATCKAEGSKSYTCDACGATRVDTIPKVPHTWNAGEVTTNATCTKAGVKTFTCTVDGCGATKTESTEKAAHSLTVEVRVITAATCKTAGKKLMKCATCTLNKEETIAIDEDAHDWSGKDGVCKNDSNHKCPHTDVAAGETCGVCGYKKPATTEPEEPEQEHTTHEAATNATYNSTNANASQHWKVCKHTMLDGSACAEHVDAENHTPGEWDHTNATSSKKCTVCQYELDTCSHATVTGGACTKCGKTGLTDTER